MFFSSPLPPFLYHPLSTTHAHTRTCMTGGRSRKTSGWIHQHQNGPTRRRIDQTERPLTKRFVPGQCGHSASQIASGWKSEGSVWATSGQSTAVWDHCHRLIQQIVHPLTTSSHYTFLTHSIFTLYQHPLFSHTHTHTHTHHLNTPNQLTRLTHPINSTHPFSPRRYSQKNKNSLNVWPQRKQNCNLLRRKWYGCKTNAMMYALWHNPLPSRQERRRGNNRKKHLLW